MPSIERRFVQGAEVRAAQSGHIEGHAAVFNEEYVLCDYPDFRVVETIKPGTFSRSISEKQDVRGLFNHEASQLLGRTTAGTLTLKEDQRGLQFDCDPPDTQVGRDVRTLIQRKDITGCSFAFKVTKQTRTEEELNGKTTVRRTIEDVDLYDVGPVTYPAYTGTDIAARELRAVFADAVPEKLMQHLPELRDAGDTPSDDGDGDNDNDKEDQMEECSCRCRACYDQDCEECDEYMATCGDAERCNGQMRSLRAKRDNEKKTKRVDGEDLTAAAFAYVGDAGDTSTWKLPIKFSSEEKTKAHIRNALARFNQTQGIPATEKPKVLAKITAAAKANGIHVAGDEKKSELDFDLIRARNRNAEIALV
jgi:HK97 family phage prohead protease